MDVPGEVLGKRSHLTPCLFWKVLGLPPLKNANITINELDSAKSATEFCPTAWSGQYD